MEKRMEGLNVFIRGVSTREEVYCNLYFLDFFEIRKMVPLLGLNQLVCIGKIANGKLGYREAFFSIEENIAITASHDIYVASRFDSYFTNFFSSKKKEEKEVNSAKEKAVGKVEFLRRHDVKDVIEQLEDKKNSRRREREMVEMEEGGEKAPEEAKDPTLTTGWRPLGRCGRDSVTSPGPAVVAAGLPAPTVPLLPSASCQRSGENVVSPSSNSAPAATWAARKAAAVIDPDGAATPLPPSPPAAARWRLAPLPPSPTRRLKPCSSDCGSGVWRPPARRVCRPT